MRQILRRKTTLALGVFLALVGIALSFPALAQEERDGIGISPTTLKLGLNPGEQISGSFKVLNVGTTPIKYRVYVSDFRINNEEYEKNFDPAPTVSSPVSWFKISGGTKELAPNDNADFKYTISIPANIVPRGYYAAIFAETLPPQTSTTGVARVKRVGTLVYLTVKGGSVEKGKFLSFDTKSWYHQKPVKSAIRIQNDGNVHFDVQGDIQLKNVFGKTVSQTNIQGTLLPATIRKFQPELTVNQPFGIYKVEGNVKFLGQAHKLGPRWILVGSLLWIGLVIILFIVWVVALIYWIKRRGRRKKNKK